MTGIVSSNKMTNALVVTIFTTKLHPKYHKRYKSKKRYLAACVDSSTFSIGQSVEIIETRPLSKLIRHKIVEN